MAKLRVKASRFPSTATAPGQTKNLQHPLGVRGPELMEWFVHTRVWRRMHGQDEGETGVDNGMAEQGFAGIGAWILAATCSARSGRSVAGRQLEGLVGRRAAVSHARLRADPSPAGAAQDGGRDGVSLCHEGIHAALEQATAAAGRSRRPPRWRRIPIRQYLRAGSDRRTASRHPEPVCSAPGRISCTTSICNALGYEMRAACRGRTCDHVFLHKTRVTVRVPAFRSGTNYMVGAMTDKKSFLCDGWILH